MDNIPSWAFQIPLVFIFIWFTLELEKRFTKFVTEILVRMDTMGRAVNKLVTVVLISSNMDKTSLEEIERMIEKMYPGDGDKEGTKTDDNN